MLPLDADAPSLALGTAAGVVKRVLVDYPSGRSEWDMIALRPGDSIIGAALVDDEEAAETHLAFISSDAQLLHFPASAVRPQGRAAGGSRGSSWPPRHG